MFSDFSSAIASYSASSSKLIIEASYYAGHGHIPSALSIVEILLGIDTVKTEDDIFILSKGHGCLAYYAYLVQKNVISIEELRNFGKKDSKLGGHPDRNKIRDIYASTGSLGHGLPIAVGAAMAKKIMKKDGKVFCVIGDGEANEGTIWEAITVSVNNNLNNLIQKFNDLFMKPDTSDQERLDRWRREVDEADRLVAEADRLKQISDLAAEEKISNDEKKRLDALHKQARTQLKKTKKSVSYTF